MNENARYILAIAREGSVSKAASSIHMSQSALSQRLKNEEAMLGSELFDRSRIPIQPTPAGLAYLEWAQEAIRAEESLRARLADLATGQTRHIDIGISGSRCSAVIAQASARFTEENPDCQLVFHEVGKREAITAAFASREIDFAVLTPQQPEPSLFMSKPICKERYVYVASSWWDMPAHPGAGPFPVVALESIAQRPFVMPQYARRLTSIAESLFELSAAKPHIVANCISASLQIELVRQGLGGSIETTAGSCGIVDSGLSYYDIDGFTGASPLFYSYRLDRDPLPDERLFVDILLDTLAQCPMLEPVQ